MPRPCDRSNPEFPALRVALAHARACLRRGMNEAILRAATSHRSLQHVLTHGHESRAADPRPRGVVTPVRVCFSAPACACADSVRANHVLPRTEVGRYRPGRDLEVKDSRERGFPSFEKSRAPVRRGRWLQRDWTSLFLLHARQAPRSFASPRRAAHSRKAGCLVPLRKSAPFDEITLEVRPTGLWSRDLRLTEGFANGRACAFSTTKVPPLL